MRCRAAAWLGALALLAAPATAADLSARQAVFGTLGAKEKGSKLADAPLRRSGLIRPVTLLGPGK